MTVTDIAIILIGAVALYELSVFWTRIRFHQRQLQADQAARERSERNIHAVMRAVIDLDEARRRRTS